jgi:hypothetical protein
VDGMVGCYGFYLLERSWEWEGFWDVVVSTTSSDAMAAPVDVFLEPGGRRGETSECLGRGEGLVRAGGGSSVVVMLV